MAEARKLITDFTGGEVSDRLMARVDRAIYDRTCRVLENFIVHPSGGLDFSPGTVFISEAKKNHANMEKLANPASLPTDIVFGCAFSPDGVYLAVGIIGSPYFKIYKRSGDIFLKLGNPAIMPTGPVGSCCFSFDGVYLAVTHLTAPCLTIYKRSGDIFTKLADPAQLPPDIGYGSAFSSDGVYLAVTSASGTPFIRIYKRNGDTFTKLADPGDLPNGGAHGCSFSSDGVYLAVGSTGHPYILIYKRSGDTFTKLADPATLPTDIGYGCSFSPGGTYLAVGSWATPYILIYKRSGDTFTKLADPATLPAGPGFGCAFHPEGFALAVAHNLTPFLTIYKRSGDAFTKLADPTTLPTGSAKVCAFSLDGASLAVGHAVTPYLSIYKADRTIRLLPFEKSSSEKYLLELSEIACRFYKDRAQLLDGSDPLEILMPWLGEHLFGLQPAQRENKLYLANRNYQLHGLKCYGDLLWQLSSADDEVALGVAHAVTPFATSYSYAGAVYSKRPNPDTLPASTGYGICFSSDGKYMAVAHLTSPCVSIYKKKGDGWEKLADPATLPTTIGWGCAFSPDALYLAVSSNDSPFITIYKRTGDFFEKLADPATLPTGIGHGCAFSADGIYLAVAHNTSPYVTIYKRDGDTFAKLANPDSLPTGNAYSCAFSDNGVYLVVGCMNPPYVIIYKRSGDTFIKLGNPTNLPTETVYGCAFSSAGRYLALALGASPYVLIYRRSGDVFIKVNDPATLPTGIGRSCAFSYGDLYLAVGHETSPFVTIYAHDGDTFTKISNPGILPTGNGYGCAFVPDGWEGVYWGSEYPGALSFHDQRLVLGRGATLRGSRVGWPQNFVADAADESAAFEYELASELLEEIMWLKTKDHKIVAGTASGEWLVSGGDAPITGSNVYADRVSGYGSAEVSAILANESLLFVQMGGNLLREFMFSQERGGYVSPNLTRLAEHIGEQGLLEFAWQRSPRSLLWTRLGNEELAALTLDRNDNIVAWSRQPRNGLVKSIVVVSGDATTGGEDTLYLCVERVINGVTRQYIEYMKPIKAPSDEKDDFFVDCGKSFDYSMTTANMTGATKATPVVVTAGTHPFANDDKIRISGVVGMTQLNGNIYTVKNKTADTFQLYDEPGTSPINGTGFGVYVSGGLCEKVVKTLSGLDHLEAETVAVYADGEALGNEVVSSGAITIDAYAAKIQVGLPLTAKMYTQRLSKFLPVRIPEAALLFKNTRGGKIGPDADHLEAIRYASSAAKTGVQEVTIGGRFSQEGSIMIVQDQPLRMTLLGIVGKMEIGE